MVNKKEVYIFCTGKNEYSYFCEENEDIYYLINAGIKKEENCNTLESCRLWIVEYNFNDFRGGQKSQSSSTAPFGQDLLKSRNGSYPAPILHIVPNVKSLAGFLYGDERLDKRIPRLFPIMDSSIWNYMVFSEDIEVKREGKTPLKKEINSEVFHIIQRIYENYQHKLYDLSVAKEYADLNARLANESYLSGDHSKGVSPIIFHSESAVKDMIRQEFEIERKTIEKIKDRSWRILLIDDKAQSPMRSKNDKDPNTPPMQITPLNEENTDFCLNCKMQIILRLLIEGMRYNKDQVDYRKFDDSFTKLNGDYISRKEINKNKKILIEYAEGKTDAFDALKKRKYDIILLDYLLENNNEDHEYGYELLNEIYKDHDVTKNNICQYGPNGKIFFMFISAYSSAVHERLLAEGLNQSEDYWYISVGACPTNTPQLFLYNLIKLMEKRLEDSHMNRLSIDGIMDDLNLIFGEDRNERTNASERYYKIQSYQYYFRSLLKDYDITVGNENLFKTNQSVLITHFLNDNINMGGLLEHLAQLVHLTGFGTIRQWPEMWEEYLYVKVQLESQIKKGNKEQEEKLKKLCRHIENYIKKLKSSAL